MVEIPRGSVWKRRQLDAWVCDFRDAQGRRHIIKAGSSKAVAEAMLSAKLKQIAVEGLAGVTNIARRTFTEITEEYLKHARTNKRSWKRDTQLLNNLRAFFGGGRLFSTITAKDVEDYKTARRESRSPATVNREIACLKHVFNLAIQWGYARENPVRKVRLFKENNQRCRFLQAHERERLLAFCSDQLRPVVFVALNTGLRLGELLSLTWADVDGERKLVHVRDSKGGEGRHVPLNDEALQALAGQTKHIDSPRVFFNRDGSPYRSVRTAFETACRKAGIEDLHFHDLRHTFASGLVMAGVDLTTISQLMGHKTITMTLRYAHLAPQHKQAAVDKLVRFWDEQQAALTRKAVHS